MVNCSNQELHVIHIILQINDPSSASPRQREDVPSRHLAAGLTRTVSGVGVCAGSCQGSFAFPENREQHRFKRSRFCGKSSVEVETNVAAWHGDSTISTGFLLL